MNTPASIHSDSFTRHFLAIAMRWSMQKRRFTRRSYNSVPVSGSRKGLLVYPFKWLPLKSSSCWWSLSDSDEIFVCYLSLWVLEFSALINNNNNNNNNNIYIYILKKKLNLLLIRKLTTKSGLFTIKFCFKKLSSTSTIYNSFRLKKPT